MNSRPLLMSVFASFDEAGVVYCLLRDGDRIDQLADLEEIDLLVLPNQLKLLSSILSDYGFASLPRWGHIPHHFFITYEENSDVWHKLDVVTDVAFGSPSHALRTELATCCLARRQKHGPVYIPSAEDELVTLLLHCALDKGRFALQRRRRLQALCDEIGDADYVTSLLIANWSRTSSWARLQAHIRSNDWAILLIEGQGAADYLASRDRFGTTVRRVRDKVLRKLNRWARRWHLRAPSVALLAPDGAGKSTLAEGLKSSFYFPAQSIYMGLYRKDGKPSKRTPLPGLGFSYKMLLQWGRYIAARYYQLQGQMVLFDRYPYDALLPSRRPLGILRRMRRWLLGHSCPAPGMVIVLDAPGKVLFARKGEHDVASLEQQRQGYLELRQRLPRVVVVDATNSADSVRREVMGLIWRGYTKHNRTTR